MDAEFEIELLGRVLVKNIKISTELADKVNVLEEKVAKLENALNKTVERRHSRSPFTHY
jgi:UDP-N-acetylmuramyl pentapeptide synthase